MTYWFVSYQADNNAVGCSTFECRSDYPRYIDIIETLKSPQITGEIIILNIIQFTRKQFITWRDQS